MLHLSWATTRTITLVGDAGVSVIASAHHDVQLSHVCKLIVAWLCFQRLLSARVVQMLTNVASLHSVLFESNTGQLGCCNLADSHDITHHDDCELLGPGLTSSQQAIQS